MDPKTASSLDPKLKEVYDRVMGSANPKASPPPQSTPQKTPTQDLSVHTPSSPTNSSNQASPLHAIPTASSPSASHTASHMGAYGANSQAGTENKTPPLGGGTIDYAALAAKYATPTPNISNLSASMSQHQAPVTPSSTIYGVVGNKAAQSNQAKNESEKGSSSKKILLLALIPIVLIGYTAIWIFVFRVDILGFLPK